MIQLPAAYFDSEHLRLLQIIYDNGGVVAGSFATAAVFPNIGVVPSDIDVWPNSLENYDKIITTLQSEKEIMSSYEISSGYAHGLSLTNLEFSFSNRNFFMRKINNKTIKVQVIKKFYLYGYDIVKDFDFSICKAFINSDLRTVQVSENMPSDINNKRLRIENVKDLPIGLIHNRLVKYIDRGFLPTIEDFIQLLSKISHADRLQILSFFTNPDRCAVFTEDFTKKLNVLKGMEILSGGA